ncbi:MAG: 3,4-dihydroxy-2-butanone-4-phosphate synthase, partial [Planctomycetes bacterium]|nr:3,4-dihydroxy-2-butanone-4-phosphate synthase [Planctomycetota bacterium]
GRYIDLARGEREPADGGGRAEAEAGAPPRIADPADRARTIQVATADDARPQDIVTPGHVFPLRARDGGVLVRAGHTEAAVDLARLAGCKPAGVICEIMKPDGEMARLPDLEVYCQQHGLLLASIADLIAYRERRESLVTLVAEAKVDTDGGPARAYCYRESVSGEHHLAIVVGDRLAPGRECPDPVLVRVAKEQVFDDVFGGAWSLSPRNSVKALTDAGGGVLLYMRDTDGTDLPNRLVKLGGTDHRSEPSSSAVMDNRDYGIGAQILRHLGVRRLRLLTNGDRPLVALAGYGLELVERVRG